MSAPQHFDSLPQRYQTGDQHAQQSGDNQAALAGDKMQKEVQGLMLGTLNAVWNDPLGAERAKPKENPQEVAKADARENAFKTVGLMDIYDHNKAGDQMANNVLNQALRERADAAFASRVNGDNGQDRSHSGFKNVRETNVAELNFNNNPHLNTTGGRPLAFAS
ncbi:MAG: hypothetical protein JSS86_14515 [Cyanobacteria bacterium SZAS LIN-2]|nr:hypothetical protein [Cyanobacteria bacterium SZAS LIN-3]MBS1997530.1 hypothetical protein [Cyanobacteria bacterium SZAS LIN-2]MBS2011101.1 hypothetical protein [Cyanobacteria bacterium SZAS TMP-1]